MPSNSKRLRGPPQRLTRHPTVDPGLGIGAIIAVLLISSIVSDTVSAIARSQGHRDLAGWAGALSPFNLVDGVQVRAFGAQADRGYSPPGTLGGIVFCLAAIGVVAAGYALLSLRYKRVSI